MSALVAGSILAVLALAFVLYPLFREEWTVVAPGATRGRPSAPLASAPEEDAIDALREIEFDRATGKLSDGDYADLKTRYTRAALAALRAEPVVGLPAPAGEDAAEDVVRRLRARQVSCATCGPRPEPDATYCSSCGGYLPGACEQCGAAVDQAGAHFCSGCGHRLAA